MKALTNHVAMSIERLHPSQQLLSIPQRDQDLGVVPDGRLEDRERTLGDFVFFQLTDLELGQVGFGEVEELARE